MYLGEAIRSFVAEDPFEQSSENREGTADAGSMAATGAELVPLAKSAEDPTGEIGRLWALVGLLRRANSKLGVSNGDLKRTNRQLSKENEALRSDLKDRSISVESFGVPTNQE